MTKLTSQLNEKRYWAFISYSHADTKEAEWLHKSLEGFRVPPLLVGTESRNGVVPRRIFPVFRDRDELPTSADLGANLHAALRNARYLVVICSPTSAKSMWVNAEVEFFKRTHGNANVLCLIIGGAPGGSGEGEQDECFCPALRHHVNPDGSAGAPAEPIAADLRDKKDGRLRSFLKIVAGILGVDFDSLYQREKRRKRKRMLIVSAVAGLLALAGLIFYQRLDSVAKSQSEIASEVKRMRETKFRAFGELPEERAQALASLIEGSGVLDVEQALAKAISIERQRFEKYNKQLVEFMKRRRALIGRVETLLDNLQPQGGWADAARVCALFKLQEIAEMPDELSIYFLDARFKMSPTSRNLARLPPHMLQDGDIWAKALAISGRFLDQIAQVRNLTQEISRILRLLPSDDIIGSTEVQPDRDARAEHVGNLKSAAWLLATDPNSDLRDFPKALVFAKKAVHLTSGQDSETLDVLAAAHAAGGNFDAALHWQKLAVERGRNASPRMQEKFLERLRLYERRDPYTRASSYNATKDDVVLCLANAEGLDAWIVYQRDIHQALESLLAQFPSTPEERFVVDAEIQRLKDVQSRLESRGSSQLNKMRRIYEQAKAEAIAPLGGVGYRPLPALNEWLNFVTFSERIWRKPPDAAERAGTPELTDAIVMTGAPPRECSVELFCISQFVFVQQATQDLDARSIMTARNFARAAARFLGVHLP